MAADEEDHVEADEEADLEADVGEDMKEDRGWFEAITPILVAYRLVWNEMMLSEPLRAVAKGWSKGYLRERERGLAMCKCVGGGCARPWVESAHRAKGKETDKESRDGCEADHVALDGTVGAVAWERVRRSG